MIPFRALLAVATFVGCCSIMAADDLSSDQIALLQDSGGWEYLTMNDSQNGFPTQHPCFDGKPHPETCSGTLMLTPDKKFVQQVSIHHQSVTRHGTYELNGNQLAFSDEFGTRDGPYSISIDTPNKMMTMNMPQVDVKLELHSEYQKKLNAKSKDKK